MRREPAPIEPSNYAINEQKSHFDGPRRVEHTLGVLNPSRKALCHRQRLGMA